MRLTHFWFTWGCRGPKVHHFTWSNNLLFCWFCSKEIWS